jgi:uncharacterized protein (DUF2267 family)
MSNHANLEKYCNDTKFWLNEIAEDIGYPEKPEWALNILKAVLSTIRDRTTVEEVFHLSAQLPVLIRGFYFEGYNPTGKPMKMYSEEFMHQIKSQIGPSIPVSSEDALRAILGMLYKKTSHGELEDIKHSMPKNIQRLWANHMPNEPSMH